MPCHVGARVICDLPMLEYDAMAAYISKIPLVNGKAGQQQAILQFVITLGIRLSTLCRVRGRFASLAWALKCLPTLGRPRKAPTSCSHIPRTQGLILPKFVCFVLEITFFCPWTFVFRKKQMDRRILQCMMASKMTSTAASSTSNIHGIKHFHVARLLQRAQASIGHGNGQYMRTERKYTKHFSARWTEVDYQKPH